MQPQDIAAGYPPEHNSPAELEQVLTEAAAQLPIVRLADAMTVEAYVLPYALGRVHPVCAWLEVGEHRIPTEFIWRDIANGEVYCHIKCAAKAAIDRADKGVPA